MYVSMYGDATYQITRTDGMSFADEPKSVTYEVDGGIAAGKTHEEIADQVNAIKAASTTEDDAPATPEVTAAGEDATDGATAPADAPADPAAPEAPTANGAATNVATGTLMGIITGTLML